MALGRRKVTQQQWNSLVESYTQRPMDHGAASRAAQVYPATAQKAWFKGLQGHGNGAAIKDIVGDIQVAAQAKLHDEREAAKATQLEEQAKARAFAVEQFAREGKLAGANVGNAVVAAGLAGQVLTAAFRAAPWVMRQLEACTKEDGDVEPCKACQRPFPPGQALGWLERAVRLQGNAVDGSLRAVELLRLHLGEPQKILRLDEVPDRTPEETLAVLDSMREAVMAGMAATGAQKPKEMPKATVH